ncbi:class I SAM-dependent methyltransferase [Anoxybacillus ayderensis]|uniref:class I SAM-dependent methyltransferase n=1 Tax=Anoxybacillus TaxID=150247 RepID=UPI0003869FBD|nr:class I SAM-dependent methyltransferase [Anoxybacillus ayderensis]EPZ37549.1 S-adenosylmethionine-dependent methyltransferase [Anoxybacillus ayderensis]MBW7652143.1 class I SAM-dependent methyltransferase [Anoxybacillus sp. ST4]
MITAEECVLYKEFVEKYQGYLYPLLGARLARDYNKINGIIIDMGTGPGYLTTQLAKRTGAKVHAVDINPAMHELTQKLTTDMGLNNLVSLDLEDVHNLSYPDNFADYIVSYSCLHHWEDPVLGIKECYRVLSTGGKIVILDTLPTNKKNLDILQEKIKEAEYFRFVKEALEESYSLNEVEEFVKLAGIENYSLEIFEFHPEDLVDCMDDLESVDFWDFEESQPKVETWILTITK